MATINIHNLNSMNAVQSDDGKFAWLTIEGHDDQVTLFVDYRLAAILAEVFNLYMRANAISPNAALKCVIPVEDMLDDEPF